MPPTHQRVNETYAHDMSMGEISRIQQQEQNEHQGTDAATLDLLHAMLNDDTSLSSVPLVDVQLPPEVAIPSEIPSSPRRVSFDLSSNTLHVHTHTDLLILQYTLNNRNTPPRICIILATVIKNRMWNFVSLSTTPPIH